MSAIAINGNAFDPADPAIQPLGLTASDAAESNYIIVQTKGGRLEADQITELAAKEVFIHEYVSDSTYLCGYNHKDLDTIRRLPFVGYANIYLSLFVVQSSLKNAAGNPATHGSSRATTASRAPHLVNVIFHEGVEGDSALKQQVATAAHVDVDGVEMDGGKIRLSIQESRLENVAKIDAVRSIHAVPLRTLYNNVARSIINADVVVGSIAYKGEGEIVAVADTGFDIGDKVHPHPAFTGRVNKLYALGRTSPISKTNDPDGHGTHVCGSVLGDHTSSSMGGRIEAPASQAQLVMQSLLDDRGSLGGIPFNLVALFKKPYDTDKARVHTNSWGSVWTGSQLPYDSSASEIDKFVWDHPEMVICFAAGNDGTDKTPVDGVTDSGLIGAEASAKNCITVGATESRRPEIRWNPPSWNPRARTFTYGEFFPRLFPLDPIASDHMANNVEGIAAFSSFGPTAEGRMKPDVVAPGTSILSARSQDITEVPTHWGISDDAAWMFETGTSMATPLVAGCCAVLRETQVKNGHRSPSAALIKALLINGAVDITGQYPGDESGTSPSFSAGFGRVDLAGSVILPGTNTNAGAGEGRPLKQGEEWGITITVPQDKPQDGNSDAASKSAVHLPHPTLKITMVYSDFPGVMLQNDLNLIVQTGSTERHGNQGTTSFPVGSTAARGFDGVNNVEQIVWTNVPVGELKIKVKARSITRPVGGSQGFAYAWRIY
ncbi:KP-43 peptidase [Boeremia exigua]|uniref:KP-43 peptidase n=1 Tax=Boeremia exigua TaxID=749465 RepID=UPI001E8E9E69|nr:KP-43 peptidase [Boeremia exigua]KAH6612365.1 KP-43 peptidase [Boeremia exigua]